MTDHAHLAAAFLNAANDDSAFLTLQDDGPNLAVANALIGIGHWLAAIHDQIAQQGPPRDLEYPPVMVDGMSTAGANALLEAYWLRNADAVKAGKRGPRAADL